MQYQKEIPFFNYPALFKMQEKGIMDTLHDVMSRGAYILQKDLSTFESNLKSFLKVIRSKEYAIDPNEYWKRFHESKPKPIKYIYFLKKFAMHLRFFNNAKWEISKFNLPGIERFFANRANHYYPDFKIAPLDIALRFAFECVPKYCFEKNNFNLPFGCHEKRFITSEIMLNHEGYQFLETTFHIPQVDYIGKGA